MYGAGLGPGSGVRTLSRRPWLPGCLAPRVVFVLPSFFWLRQVTGLGLLEM